MTLQDKLKEIKDRVAVKHGFEKWLVVLFHYKDNKITSARYLDLENEAMIAFASYCCERQRMSDYKISNNIDILNNPLITDELTKHIEDGKK
jgi:hypothetical protein